nr:hypothetical protein [Candidatus Hamiltonella defensa]
MAFLNQEILDTLSYHFCNNGVVIKHNKEFDLIAGLDQGVVVYLKSGKKVKAACLFYANRRTGNTKELLLENISLSTDERRFL